MIISDLDNTLLRSDKTISDYTLSILQKCRSKGIKVAFATARSTRSAARMLAQFTPDIFIGYGGALAVSGTDDIIYRSAIPADVSAKLIAEFAQTPEVLYVYAASESVALTNDPALMGVQDYTHYEYHEFSGSDNCSYLKLSVTATCPNVVERIAANYPMCDMLRYTGENLYRFANSDATKWNAIKAVAEHSNISTDTIIAFGDDINDFEMIKNCGTGIAVANAIDEVKAVAGYICGTNENDGVAKWLAEHVL